jgi:cellulose synthase/poly-beta-1,6-N-acetylglucosamine synthase-like glycosyltransferase
MKNIVLLIRSYNRFEYLEQTLKSVLESDIDLCYKRYIYDDASDDGKVNEILMNNNYVNVPGKEFIVIKEYINLGCKFSYIKALEFIENNNDKDDLLICTIDNDVIVKPDFISIILNEYENIFNNYKSHDVLITGFNPTNAHLNMIEDFGSYYRKETCGGVNFIFHIKFLDFIKTFWEENLDWGINWAMKDRGMPLLCLKKSVVNHVGLYGLNSEGESRIDQDTNFSMLEYSTKLQFTESDLEF